MHCEGRWMADPRMLPELLRRLALRLLGPVIRARLLPSATAYYPRQHRPTTA